MKKIIPALLFFLYTTGAFAQLSGLLCRTLGEPDGSQTQYNEIGYFINNVPIEYNGCGFYPAVMIAVIDSFCQPWTTCDHNFGQANTFNLTSGTCGVNASGYISGCNRNRPESCFMFRYGDSLQMAGLNNMMSIIPDGFYVLAYSWFTFPYTTIPAFQSAIQNLSTIPFPVISDTLPFILFTRKGDLTAAITIFGNAKEDTLELNTNLACLSIGITTIDKSGFNLFPNPVTDQLILKGFEGYRWQIFNPVGELIFSGKYETEITEVSKLPSGYYILNLENKNEVLNKPFLKE